MIKNAPNINSLWAALLIEELVRVGVDMFCVAPGSRSSPLTVAVARHRRARSVVHYDERGAAFHALGYGRASGKPAAVITTSGTALANVWPAVAEASLDRVPLVVLSGDRPPELQDTGANQTIDQVKFFGDYVRWCVNLPCPDAAIAPTALLTSVDQAVYRSNDAVAGPVHINCMFREPLAPVSVGRGEDFGSYLEILDGWLKSDRPYTEYRRAVGDCDASLLHDLAALANQHERGLLVVGQLAQPSECQLMAALAERLGWPLLPDITSGIRLGGGGSAAVPFYDILLGSPSFTTGRRVDVVLHVGGRPTSRHLLDYLDRQRPRHYVLVEDYPGRQDPIHATTLRLDMPVTSFARQVLPLLAGRSGSSWLGGWQVPSDLVCRRMESLLAASPRLTEPLVAWLVSHHIGEAEGLFLGSSMPVRDMDVFADFGRGFFPVAANRGASGIDGTIATAAGFARGLGRRTTVLMGDLAFLHDMNSLGLLRSLDVPLVIVLLNNDGGGIFSFLPIAEHGDVFESHFGTPHGLSFEASAHLFGLSYAQPETLEDFIRAYQDALEAPSSTLIEVRTDRRENVRVHRLLLDALREAIGEH